MSALREIKGQITNIGYSAIERDYVFSDVFDMQAANRTVSLAAFAQTPPSYRSAAIAVVETDENAQKWATRCRALGAPLLFVINGNDVSLWQVGAQEVTRKATATVAELAPLFAQNAADWAPESIRRAKAIGQFDRSVQLDFVDIGLLPAIEGQVHTKLDMLLSDALAEAVGLRRGRAHYWVDQRLLFRTVFRLLAAKVLQDRSHKLAASWDPDNIQSVLEQISSYYTLDPLHGEQSALQAQFFASTWERFRHGINFRNISADDLAFVYENTLITQETRKDYGTHGTPRTVAEYVVGRLEMWRADAQNIRIYEPFTGAGIFLVAALRNLREQLPIKWTDSQRHKYLVQRIRGDEFDPFAKEVATLSLILADYPNANGWDVSQVDLFERQNLQDRIADATIVLCNPPFEDFNLKERRYYVSAAARSVSKPIFALDTVLDSAPTALGFVLPEPFLKGSKYREQRKRIDKLYGDIELVALPDRTFKHSVIRSSLLIAREKRAERDASAGRLISTVVTVQDREAFLRSGKVSSVRVKSPHAIGSDGELWINELNEVWSYLEHYPKLKCVAKASRGIEWHQSQAAAYSAAPRQGFAPGVLAANAIRSFAISNTGFLDIRADQLRGRAIEAPWRQNKLIANASRLSRAAWCFAAAIDRSGLIVSQQIYGIWPTAEVSLEALAAILNGPVAIGYLATHSPPDRIRLKTLLSVPVPPKIPNGLGELVKKYSRLVAQDQDLFSPKRTERADLLLDQIDAHVLRAYDLPLRTERQLLEYFRGEKRPTRHDWTHWYPEDFRPFVPLHEYLSKDFVAATEPWIQKILQPLPPDEARALRSYMD